MVTDSVGAELTEWLRSMPSGVDGEVEAARQRLGRLIRSCEGILASAAEGQGLSIGDLEALSVLRRSGPPYERTPKQLGETLGLTSGTVSVRLDRLIRAGLVEPAGASDGRSKPVRLTRRGHAQWRAATGRRTAFERELFTEALTGRELTTLNGLLAALLGHFEQQLGPAPKHDTPRLRR
ncbi:MarR family winged helix-turn-helix transcriptional regulator [Sciscionella marina]|uniref:MarR family winged helix-turn-helix transcriptional regulator n=1 Tax=Sciscionella marina TaxID=508770 RepID=UPI0003A410B1|nr:MarR family transcriptional regulator [Sciscionella marina]